MENSFDDFVNSLKSDEMLNKLIAQVYEPWGGDFENMWGVFFSGIAREVVKANGSNLFYDKVEYFLVNGEEDISNLIATCALEETYKEAIRVGNWDIIHPMLGTESVNYINEFNNLYN